jgi:hypothetical protein
MTPLFVRRFNADKTEPSRFPLIVHGSTDLCCAVARHLIGRSRCRSPGPMPALSPVPVAGSANSRVMRLGSGRTPAGKFSNSWVKIWTGSPGATRLLQALLLQFGENLGHFLTAVPFVSSRPPKASSTVDRSKEGRSARAFQSFQNFGKQIRSRPVGRALAIFREYPERSSAVVHGCAERGKTGGRESREGGHSSS